MRTNLKNVLRDSIYSLNTNVISLTYTGYIILTLKLIRGLQRSLKVKRRSKLKNTLRDSIFGMYTHIISLNNISYDILISKVIRGHQRSLEVKRRLNF